MGSLRAVLSLEIAWAASPAYMSYIITDSDFVVVLVLVTLPSLSPSSWCVRTRCVSLPLVFSSSPVLGIWRGEEAKEREGEREREVEGNTQTRPFHVSLRTAL